MVVTRQAELFAGAGLPTPEIRHYQVPSEMNGLIAMSFQAGDDRDGLRRMILNSVDGEKLGMGAIRYEDTVRLAYPSAILSAQKTRS